jgi:hypothetical protein
MESEILELKIAQQGKFGYRGPIAMPCFEGRPQGIGDMAALDR